VSRPGTRVRRGRLRSPLALALPLPPFYGEKREEEASRRGAASHKVNHRGVHIAETRTTTRTWQGESLCAACLSLSLSLSLSRLFSSGLLARDLAAKMMRAQWFAVPRLVPHYDLPVHL